MAYWFFSIGHLFAPSGKAHLSCLPSVFSFLIAFMAWGRNSFSSDGLFLLCFFLEFSSRPLFWLSKFLWPCHKLIDIFQYCQETLHWSFQEHLPCFGCGRVSFNHEISLFGSALPDPGFVWAALTTERKAGLDAPIDSLLLANLHVFEALVKGGRDGMHDFRGAMGAPTKLYMRYRHRWRRTWLVSPNPQNMKNN